MRLRPVVLLLLAALALVEAKRGRADERHRDRGAEFWSVIKYTYLAVFAPALGYFVYAVAKDPLTPQLAKEAWARAKRRFVAFLGKAPEDRAERSRQRSERRQAAAALRRRRSAGSAHGE